MKKNKISKVSGGNKTTAIDLVNRTTSKVADKNGAEISAKLNNFKIGGDLKMVNFDTRNEQERTSVSSREKVVEITSSLGKSS